MLLKPAEAENSYTSSLSDAFQTTHPMPGGQSFPRAPQVYHVEEKSNTAVKATKQSIARLEILT